MDIFFQNSTEVLDYYLKHRREREDEIIGVLAENKTAMSTSDITSLLYMVMYSISQFTTRLSVKKWPVNNIIILLK